MKTYREQEWQQVRRRGKGAFMFQHGFLRRGLPLGVILGLAIEASLGGSFPEAFREPSFWGRLLFAVAVFTGSGCVTAHFNWRLHERRYGYVPGGVGGSGSA